MTMPVSEVAPWQPEPTFCPSSTCTPLPSPVPQHQLVSNLCGKRMQGAGRTLTSLCCRRSDEVSEDQAFGWAGIDAGTRGRGKPEGSNWVCLYFTFCGTISYTKPVPSLCQYVSVIFNKGRSHIAGESTTVPSHIHSWPSVWLHVPCAIANAIIRGLLKYHELKAGKS